MNLYFFYSSKKRFNMEIIGLNGFRSKREGFEDFRHGEKVKELQIWMGCVRDD